MGRCSAFARCVDVAEQWMALVYGPVSLFGFIHAASAKAGEVD
jgi:hypothetical protein